MLAFFWQERYWVLKCLIHPRQRCNVAMHANSDANRAGRMAVALRLEAVTIAWMIVEAAVSIGAGVTAKSLLLVAFGVDSLIELVSACLLYCRLSREAQAVAGGNASVGAAERRTAKIGGYLLYALALYVVVQSIYGLSHRYSAEESWWGIAITVIAALGMPMLAKAKLRVADEIRSRALRADAVGTLTCGYLGVATLAGLLANAFLHWWWLDSVAALLLVPFLANEGREAIRGKCCNS